MFTYHEPVDKKIALEDAVESHRPALGSSRTVKVAQSVSKSLQSHNTAQPSVKEIERIKRDTQKVKEGVIPASHEEQGDHVGDSEGASTIDEHSGRRAHWLRKVDAHNTESYIGGEVAEEEDELKARGESSNVDGRAKLELAVVPLAENG